MSICIKKEISREGKQRIRLLSKCNKMSHFMIRIRNHGLYLHSYPSSCFKNSKALHHFHYRGISSSKLIIEKTQDESRLKNVMPKNEDLKFGQVFSNHMLMVEWDEEKKWGEPKIVPFQDLKLNPAATALHYGKWW